MSGFLTRRLQLAGAKALGKGVRGAFGKVKKGIATAKAKRAASKRVPADLKKALEKSLGKARKASEVFPFVGAKSPKKVPLKNTKATTIKGINIKTKAGKRFGERIKNQPKLIAGQKPEGMRDDLPADIDVPSFLKKKPKKMKQGGGLRDIPEGNKGLPKLPTEVRNKMGFKKDGGLVSATAKLKAQGLKDGGPVRGKARGMGAATKGGGYNV